MTYTCPHCGEQHDEWPTITFKAPDNYTRLSEKEKKNASFNSDTCVIRYANQTDRFIRCVMMQKVNEHCQDLEYGIWISLNEKNFTDYLMNINNEDYKAEYFGWLSNWIPEYEKFVWIKMHIMADNKEGQFPKAYVQIVNHPDIPLVRDYFQGISKEAAQARVEKVMGK